MIPAEALRCARAAVASGHLGYTRHAYEEMEECGAEEPDVERAIVTATVALYQGGDRWKLSNGVDTAGDVLVVIASIDPVDVLVVTVW